LAIIISIKYDPYMGMRFDEIRHVRYIVLAAEGARFAVACEQPGLIFEIGNSRMLYMILNRRTAYTVDCAGFEGGRGK
jgi:hypothetical protein